MSSDRSLLQISQLQSQSLPSRPLFIKQLSVNSQATCLVCLEEMITTNEHADGIQMSCACILHYHCLVEYVQSKLGDRASLTIHGIACPSGKECQASKPLPISLKRKLHSTEAIDDNSCISYMSLSDLESVVEYHTNHTEKASLDALLQRHGVKPLTQRQVAQLREWLDDMDTMEGLREVLGDATINDTEMEELMALGIKRLNNTSSTMPPSSSLPLCTTPSSIESTSLTASTSVTSSSEFVDLVRRRTDLPAELTKELLIHLKAMRGEGYGRGIVDPYVLATTKACPTCGMRSTHYHGHQCHMISPVTRGCPNCHVKYCYRCLATEKDNITKRGEEGKCDCGYWHNFCRPIKDSKEVTQFIHLNNGVPYDNRCGCVICPLCRAGKPCAECPGDCSVCKGILNPGPMSIGSKTWVPLVSSNILLSEFDILKNRLFEASRQGTVAALIDILAEAELNEGEEAGFISKLFNSVDRHNKTPFLVAIESRHTQVVQFLWTVQGIDINKADCRGRTPLYCACAEDCIEFVRLLLSSPDIDVNKADYGGRTPLHRASSSGHSKIVELLIAKTGIDINKADNNGDTPLNCACQCSRLRVVKHLLSMPGIDINKTGNDGNTPLNSACREGQTGIVELLLSMPGIDINKGTTANDSTPLHRASFDGYTDIVKLLLSMPDININACTLGNGNTPLHRAILGNSIDAVGLLSSMPNIDINKVNNRGRTPLFVASSMGNITIVKLLLSTPGVDVNKTDVCGRTPLGRASTEGLKEIVSLLSSIPDINMDKVSNVDGTALT